MAKAAPVKQIVSNVNFADQPSKNKEFELIEFVNCSFNDLSSLSFLDCDFKGCNLSNCRTMNTRLQNCLFKDSKLLGMNFSGAKDLSFEVHFVNCNMDYTFFDKKKMNRSSFANCKLHSANFSNADLSKCTLTDCDFLESIFSDTDLSGVDLSSNLNLLIDPESNRIKKAKFLMNQLPGLLYRYDIRIE